MATGRSQIPTHTSIMGIKTLPPWVHLLFVVIALLATSCSKSTEAETRKEQEEMFADLVGFQPPKSVTEIKYKDVYNRHLMNGGWGRWMRFTYSEDIFAKILKDRGFKLREELRSVNMQSDAAPKWWQNVDQKKVRIYLRGDKDTQEDEGYSFQEYIWHDTNSNFVYFHKMYWD